jgi:hypothetical protein
MRVAKARAMMGVFMIRLLVADCRPSRPNGSYRRILVTEGIRRQRLELAV